MNEEYEKLPKILYDAIKEKEAADEDVRNGVKGARERWEFALYDLDSILKGFENGSSIRRDILSDIRSKYI